MLYRVFRDRNVFMPQNNLHDYMDKSDLKGVKNFFTSVFASEPHKNFENEDKRRFENYFYSKFYLYLLSLGYEVKGIQTFDNDNLNFVVLHDNAIYI